MKSPRFLLLATFAGFCLAGPAAGQMLSEEARGNVIVASHLDADITLDGRLDEAAWQTTEPVTGFRQYEPSEGTPASQRTEVRLLYGERGLYVGARLYDEDPAAVEDALGRRDEYNRADWFLVAIDAYFDRKTAYVFGVSAAGVQLDGLRAEGGGPGGGGGGGVRGVDESWDAVWHSAARVTPEGWVAEMRIPYSMLRFSEAEAQTWGVHFTRRIPRLGEVVEWPLVPRTERSNLVAGFGRLEGIAGVEPQRNVQIQPYTVSRLDVGEHPEAAGRRLTESSVDVGGDLKVGLGSSMTLDVTVNPDFGQVEADPAVLNLTAFENFFEERRPFFVEGSQIYDFAVGPGRLLYTRRIGAAAPIVGAAKLSGRTAEGLSFGVLGATTGSGFSPARTYGVTRASQQLGAYSSLGGIVTGFDAPELGGTLDGRRRSVSGGADWDLRFLQNRYGVEGFAAVTHRRFAAADAQTGFAGKVWLRRRQGAWTGFVGADVFSDRFNPNDVGQLRENNFFAFLTSVDHDIQGGRPFGPFLRASVEGFVIQQVAYDTGLNLGQRAEVGSRWTLRGFQQVELAVEAQNPFGGYDLYETRGLGPWARPAGVGIGGEFETDERRAWMVEPELAVLFNEDGGRGYEAGLRGEWNVGARLNLSGDLQGGWESGVTAWTANEALLRAADGWLIGRDAAAPDGLSAEDYIAFDDAGLLDPIVSGLEPFAITADGDRYFVPVFGARDTRSLDLTLRGTVTFIPDLSLQLYSQLFLARGRYERFQILQNRDALVPFDVYPKRDDFAFSSLQSNLVLRWEYRPGSSLYLVWTHGRRAEDALNPLAPWGVSPFGRPVGDQLSDTFAAFAQNVLLLKLNYTFLR